MTNEDDEAGRREAGGSVWGCLVKRKVLDDVGNG